MRRLAAWLLALILLAACGGSSEDGIDVSLRVVAPDNNIRLEGAECAGARPFEHVHAGAGYALEDAQGEVLAEGESRPGSRRTPIRRSTGASSGSRPSASWR